MGSRLWHTHAVHDNAQPHRTCQATHGEARRGEARQTQRKAAEPGSQPNNCQAKLRHDESPAAKVLPELIRRARPPEPGDYVVYNALLTHPTLTSHLLLTALIHHPHPIPITLPSFPALAPPFPIPITRYRPDCCLYLYIAPRHAPHTHRIRTHLPTPRCPITISDAPRIDTTPTTSS